MPFKIMQVAVDRAGKITPLQEHMGSFATREDAITYIEKHIKRFDHNGYDAKNDDWWGRSSVGEFDLRTFYVSAE